MKILIVEDEEKMARFIKRGLEAKGYVVDVVADGETAKNRIVFGGHDCVVLDVMLPSADGIEVCRYVREKGSVTPIIMLTAKDTLEDKLLGLGAGADDYLTKPFAFAELEARIVALLRRRDKKVQEVFRVKDLELNSSKHIVLVGGKEISFTLKEYAVLELLLRNKDLVLTREQILDHCWGYDFDSFSNVVDVYIRRVRKKLNASDMEKYIKTVRGVGYSIKST